MGSPRFGVSKIVTLLRDIHPHGFIVECIFVGIKPTEGRITL